MADVKEDNLGTPKEFELRDDDRATDTSYGRPRRSSTQSLAFMTTGAVLVALILGWIYYSRNTQRPAEGPAQAVPTTANR